MNMKIVKNLLILPKRIQYVCIRKVQASFSDHCKTKQEQTKQKTKAIRVEGVGAGRDTDDKGLLKQGQKKKT